MKKRSHKFIDLTGRTFDRLKVLYFVDSVGNKGSWMCECSCSNRKIILGQSLTRGMTKSCGCFRREVCLLNTTWGKHGVGVGSMNALFAKYRNSAISHRGKKLKWEINLEDFARVTSLDCFYCKTPPSQIYFPRGSNGSYAYNGLDRVDSDLDYTLENVVPCCKICNRAKNDMGQIDFMGWLKKIASLYGEARVAA